METKIKTIPVLKVTEAKEIEKYRQKLYDCGVMKDYKTAKEREIKLMGLFATRETIPLLERLVELNPIKMYACYNPKGEIINNTINKEEYMSKIFAWNISKSKWSDLGKQGYTCKPVLVTIKEL